MDNARDRRLVLGMERLTTVPQFVDRKRTIDHTALGYRVDIGNLDNAVVDSLAIWVGGMTDTAWRDLFATTVDNGIERPTTDDERAKRWYGTIRKTARQRATRLMEWSSAKPVNATDRKDLDAISREVLVSSNGTIRTMTERERTTWVKAYRYERAEGSAWRDGYGDTTASVGNPHPMGTPLAIPERDAVTLAPLVDRVTDTELIGCLIDNTRTHTRRGRLYTVIDWQAVADTLETTEHRTTLLRRARTIIDNADNTTTSAALPATVLVSSNGRSDR